MPCYIHRMRDGDDALAATAAKPPLKQRLTALFEEYGWIAIVTYFTLSILTIIGFSIAIWLLGSSIALRFGVQPSTETGVIGVLFAGWALGKATLPIRIPIALALTPVVALLVRRRRGAPDRNQLADEPGTEPGIGSSTDPDGEPPAPGAS